MALVLVPLPDTDFDPTESAVPWRVLTAAGHGVVFATERGDVTPQCDPRLIDGVLFGQLGAEGDALACYRAMEEDPAFKSPVAWSSVDITQFDALLLPGGHAPGMRQYLGSEGLHKKVAEFWKLDRPVGAICHGTVVLARAIDPETGKSVINGRRSTCLPDYMERIAYAITAWKLGNYYRTYPEYVEAEVRRALGDEGEFVRGPISLLKRGSSTNDDGAFIVDDGRYISARWPGDAYLFAKKLAALLP